MSCGPLIYLLRVDLTVPYFCTQLTLFDAFAVDENPHVRQAACLALPALTRHLHPYSFKKEHTLKAIEGFCGDETSEIQNTALEVLGELIYAFHDDDEGLPNELITYFLGPPRVKKELVPEAGGTLNIYSTAQGLSLLSGLDDEGDYRQIVCAFNVRPAPLPACFYMAQADTKPPSCSCSSPLLRSLPVALAGLCFASSTWTSQRTLRCRSDEVWQPPYMRWPRLSGTKSRLSISCRSSCAA